MKDKTTIERILQTWKDNGKASDFEVTVMSNGHVQAAVRGRPDREIRGRSWDFKKQKWIPADGPFKHICLGSWTVIPPAIIIAQGEYHPKKGS